MTQVVQEPEFLGSNQSGTVHMYINKHGTCLSVSGGGRNFPVKEYTVTIQEKG